MGKYPQTEFNIATKIIGVYLVATVASVGAVGQLACDIFRLLSVKSYYWLSSIGLPCVVTTIQTHLTFESAMIRSI